VDAFSGGVLGTRQGTAGSVVVSLSDPVDRKICALQGVRRMARGS
jgi:hypothetical protein